MITLSDAMKYDEALFKQILETKKRDGEVGLGDIHETFARVASDIYTTGASEDIDYFILDEVVPVIARQLEKEGWKIHEYEQMRG